MTPDRDFQRAGYDAERRLLASVEPHWPTYHRVMRLCDAVACEISAARARDVGDYLAFKDSWKQLVALLDDLRVDPESQAADIWDTVTRTKRLTIQQSKALAMSAAKAATLINDHARGS